MAATQLASRQIPAGGGGSFAITQATINVGIAPVIEKQFTITNAGITAASRIDIWQAGEADTAENADEQLAIYQVVPAAGQFTFWAANRLNGQTIRGQFKVNYTLG